MSQLQRGVSWRGRWLWLGQEAVRRWGDAALREPSRSVPAAAGSCCCGRVWRISKLQLFKSRCDWPWEQLTGRGGRSLQVATSNWMDVSAVVSQKLWASYGNHRMKIGYVIRKVRLDNCNSVFLAVKSANRSMRGVVTSARGGFWSRRVAARRRIPFGQVSPTAGFIPKQRCYFTNCCTRA